MLPNENTLASKLRSGKPVIGLNNGCPAANIVERMCQGWDFVWIDGQHGQHTYESVLQAIRAAGVIGVDAVVRVPGHEYGILGPFADLACSAIMVPMVQSAEQAGAVRDALRFPPAGNRSYGGRRVIDLYGRQYYRDRELLVIAQIETLESVDKAEEIAAVEGIDVLFFGPDDMKMRLGVDIDTPATDSPVLLDAMKAVGAAASAAGKSSGTVIGSPGMIQDAIAMGYRLLACGADIGFIRTAAVKRLEEIRGALSSAGFDAPGGKWSTY